MGFLERMFHKTSTKRSKAGRPLTEFDAGLVHSNQQFVTTVRRTSSSAVFADQGKGGAKSVKIKRVTVLETMKNSENNNAKDHRTASVPASDSPRVRDLERQLLAANGKIDELREEVEDLQELIKQLYLQNDQLMTDKDDLTEYIRERGSS